MAMLVMMRKGKYINSDAVEKTIRYITRTRSMEDRADELIAWGGMGIGTYQTPELVIKQFCRLQTVYGIAARGGSRVFHEVLEIKEDEFVKLGYDYARIWETAMSCANQYYEMGYQVIFAIHHTKGNCYGGNKGIHIHFVVNTISFLTGNKWHTNFKINYQREQLFNKKMYEFMDESEWIDDFPEI